MRLFRKQFGQRGVSYISVVVGLVIVGALYYVLFTGIATKPRLDVQVEQAIEKEGINTSSPQGFVSTTRNRVNAVNQRHQTTVDFNEAGKK